MQDQEEVEDLRRGKGLEMRAIHHNLPHHNPPKISSTMILKSYDSRSDDVSIFKS